MIPLAFFALVFLLSIPLWAIGGATGIEMFPGLPVSALQAFCPAIAATILVYREKGRAGALILMKRAFDYKRIRGKMWYIPIVILMPLVMFSSYWLMRALRMPLPGANIPVIAIPVMLLAFFIAAVGEELGWTGYAIEPIERRWNAPTAGIVLGVVWAVWHIVPYMQAHRAPRWIVWQCLFTVALRVLLVWIYVSAGRSVFAVALTHAMANVSMFLFPNLGSHYDPLVTCLVIAPCSILSFISLNRKRISRSIDNV